MSNQTSAELHETTHRVLRNSIANIATGISTSLMYLLLPPILARTLTVQEFGVWALISQLANYLSRLDLGIQGSIGRYVAFYNAHNDQKSIDRFVNTAFTALTVIAAVAALATMVASSHLKTAFPQIPLSLTQQSAVALRLMGGAMLVGLVSSVATGTLVGIERNEVVTYIIGPGRTILAILLVLAALTHLGIIGLAITFAVINLLCYGLLWRAAYRNAHLRVRPFTFDVAAAREIRDYCASTTIWGAAMLVISGLDTLIVGRLDFSRVAAYAACAALIAVLGGLQQAMFGPLLQVGARYTAQGRNLELGDLLERATRVSAVVLLICIVPLLVFSNQFLSVWLGAVYSKSAVLILRLLLIGHAIRLAATPYALLLLATGNHQKVRFVPIVEGIVNLGVAIVLGLHYGASGVACGVVAGAVTAQCINFFYNLPKTHGDVVNRGRFLRSAIIVPIMCFTPVGMTLLIPNEIASGRNIALIKVMAILGALALLWRWALRKSERLWVISYGRRLLA